MRGLFEELQGVGHEDDALAASLEVHNALLEQVLADVRIHCGERIVEEVNISIRVHGASQADTRFLSTG